MQKTCSFIILLLLGFIVNVSYPQSIKELDIRNGFKDIKLGTKVHQYEGLQYKEKIKDELFKQLSVYTKKKGYYKDIGSIKIYQVEVFAYKDEIYKIKIITEKDSKLYAGLKKIFGQPSFSPRKNNYYWSTKNVTLTFGSNTKSKLQLEYTSRIMKKRLKEEKKEEIKSISEGF